jgi:hypothetical protein
MAHAHCLLITNLKPGGPPLAACPRLLIQYIHRYPSYWRPFLHPQPEDAPYRGDWEPLIMEFITVTYIIGRSISTCTRDVPCSIRGQCDDHTDWSLSSHLAVLPDKYVGSITARRREIPWNSRHFIIPHMSYHSTIWCQIIAGLEVNIK